MRRPDPNFKVTDASVDVLLSTAYYLTHQMHALSGEAREAATRGRATVLRTAIRELREQRTLIDAEIQSRVSAHCDGCEEEVGHR